MNESLPENAVIEIIVEMQEESEEDYEAVSKLLPTENSYFGSKSYSTVV